MRNIYKKPLAIILWLSILLTLFSNAFAVVEIHSISWDVSVTRWQDINLQWHFEWSPEFSRCVWLWIDNLHTRTNIGVVQWNETTYEPIDSASFPTTSSYISSSTTSLEIWIKCFRTDWTSETDEITVTIEENNGEPDINLSSIYLLDTASNVQKGDTITTKSYISITWMDDGDSFTYHAYLYNENNGFLESCYKNLITNGWY